MSSFIYYMGNPVTLFIMGFFYSFGGFDYAIQSVESPRKNWKVFAIFFSLLNSIIFTTVELLFNPNLPPFVIILIFGCALLPEMIFLSKDRWYIYPYLEFAVLFVLLIAFNFSILLFAGFSADLSPEMTSHEVMAITSLMLGMASLYLIFDSRSSLIKLENFNHLIHNPRGITLFVYFLIFDISMFISMPFMYILLFVSDISAPDRSLIISFMFIQNFVILLSSFLIVLFSCRLDSEAHQKDAYAVSASTDSLTGLLNRTGFEDKLSACNDIGIKGCFFLIDLDNFKSVNDVFGHLKGDDVLKETAYILKDSFRQSDYVARIGGDEFVAYALNMSDIEIITEKATEICESIKRDIVVDSDTVKIGCSVGIKYNPGNLDYHNLSLHADKLLYKAKSAGKGTFFIDN